jgi:FkbM family methyltransferase
LKTYFSRTNGDGNTQRPLLIYGAGKLGREVALRLRSRGILIEAFIDASAGPGEIRDGISVYRLYDWAANKRPEDFSILVSIHNPYVNVAPILGELRSAGFAEVLTMPDYVNALPGDLRSLFWIAPSDFYSDKTAKIQAAAGLLADEVSRAWFDANMKLRQTGDYAALPEPSSEDQYVPADIQRWRDPMRLIDCGAFDGDTIDTLMRNGYALEGAAAFEPDQQNYAKLAGRFRELNAVFLPCGVSSATEMLRFDSGHGTSSRIDRDGGVAIQCVTIDEALPVFCPTLIKWTSKAPNRRHCAAPSRRFAATSPRWPSRSITHPITFGRFRFGLRASDWTTACICAGTHTMALSWFCTAFHAKPAGSCLAERRSFPRKCRYNVKPARRSRAGATAWGRVAGRQVFAGRM